MYIRFHCKVLFCFASYESEMQTIAKVADLKHAGCKCACRWCFQMLNTLCYFAPRFAHLLIIISTEIFSVFKRIILKRKSFTTLTKIVVPDFGPKQSLSDNKIDKSLYLPCIQHKNQNGVAYGCRAAAIILRQPPILKSHGYNTSHVMRKIFF